MGVNKTSEAFDLARNEYIEGYEEKNKLIFPTLALVAKEFNVSFSTLRKKTANERCIKKESFVKILVKNMRCESNLRENIQI